MRDLRDEARMSMLADELDQVDEVVDRILEKRHEERDAPPSMPSPQGMSTRRVYEPAAAGSSKAATIFSDLDDEVTTVAGHPIDLGGEG